jgi:hypothetical protein
MKSNEKEKFRYFNKDAFNNVDEHLTLQEIKKKLSDFGIGRGIWIFPFMCHEHVCFVTTKDGSSLKILVPEDHNRNDKLKYIDCEKDKIGGSILAALREQAKDTYQKLVELRSPDDDWMDMLANMSELGFDD